MTTTIEDPATTPQDPAAAAVDAENTAADADGALAVAMTAVRDAEQRIAAGENVPDREYLAAQSKAQRARLVAQGARERATAARQAADQAAAAEALAAVVIDARALAAGDMAREVEGLVDDLDRIVGRLLELRGQHRDRVREVGRRLADLGVGWTPAPSTRDLAWHGLVVQSPGRGPRVGQVDGFTVDGRTVDAGAVDSVIGSLARRLGSGR